MFEISEGEIADGPQHVDAAFFFGAHPQASVEAAGGN
jgi:hypothetical protein